MQFVKFSFFIFIAVPSITPQVEGQRRKCYECKDDLEKQDLKKIRPCEGFKPNSTYEIECESEKATLCLSIVKFTGSNWEIGERCCGGYMERADGTRWTMQYTRSNVTNYRMNRWIELGHQISSVVRRSGDCSRETRSLLKDGNRNFCPCHSDLCNSVEEQTIQRVENPKIKCYECTNETCSKFQENATYEINCENENSTFCFTILEFDGTNWAVKERGCAGLMKNNKKLTVVPHRTGDNFIPDGYKFVSKEIINLHGDTYDCGRNTSLLRPALKIETCACNSDLCNAGVSKRAMMKCYVCSNEPGIRPCSGFEKNSTYEMDCERENLNFCSTRMEYNGSNWTVKERGCAGLMIKNKKLIVVPNRRGQNLIGYQFVSRKLLDLYGDIDYCGRMGNSLIRACGSNLCNVDQFENQSLSNPTGSTIL